jgi:hypothetical protein
MTVRLGIVFAFNSFSLYWHKRFLNFSGWLNTSIKHLWPLKQGQVFSLVQQESGHNPALIKLGGKE